MNMEDSKMKIVKISKPICAFCHQEQDEVMQGKAGAICISCLAEVTKMAEDKDQAEQRPEEHLRVD